MIRNLHQHGCTLDREGGRHSIYFNPANNQSPAVPRHSETDNMLARKICRELGIPNP